MASVRERMSESSVLRMLLNAGGNEFSDVTSFGRLFQTQAAVTIIAYMVECFAVDAERSRRRDTTSDVRWNSSGCLSMQAAEDQQRQSVLDVL